MKTKLVVSAAAVVAALSIATAGAASTYHAYRMDEVASVVRFDDGAICVTHKGGGVDCAYPCMAAAQKAAVKAEAATVPTAAVVVDPPSKHPNQGRGNGGEGADPGNSNNHNPSRDERGQTPGRK